MLAKQDVDLLPRGVRGFYVLYKGMRRSGARNVVYVGMSYGGQNCCVRTRLRTHRRKKGRLWTYCSVFEVWENVRDDEIAELEGLFRQIYKTDSRANKLNVRKGFRKLKAVPRLLTE